MTTSRRVKKLNYDYDRYPEGTCLCGHGRNEHAHPGALGTKCGSSCPCPEFRNDDELPWDSMEGAR